MEAADFDALTRPDHRRTAPRRARSLSVAFGHSRRGLMRVVSTVVLTGPLGLLGLAQVPAKRKRHMKKRKQKRHEAFSCAGQADGTHCVTASAGSSR